MGGCVRKGDSNEQDSGSLLWESHLGQEQQVSLTKGYYLTVVRTHVTINMFAVEHLYICYSSTTLQCG